MPTNKERAVSRAATRARKTLVEDLVRALGDSGMRVSELARFSGVDDGYITRILRGAAEPSIDTWARLAAPLGLDLSMRLYPNTGPIVRDRFAAPMLELLLGDIHPRWARWTEVNVTRPSKGAIDLVLHEPRERVIVASELQGELRRLEQLVRWHAMKADALPSWDAWPHLGEPAIGRLLVVRRTRATRAVATEFARQLRTAYPAHPDDALESLRGTTSWPGAAMLWVTVEGTRSRWGSGR